MMKYKNFLLETAKHELDEPSYKNKIAEDDAIKLIKQHCKNVDPKYPLYRGMNGKDEFYTIEGNIGGRKSKNTSNHYTLIIDEQLKNNYRFAPLRSRSLICTNDLSYTVSYGNNTYALFPYDNVEIGKCSSFDLWETNIHFNGHLHGSIDSINSIFAKIIKNPISYQDIVDSLAKVLDDPKNEDSSDEKEIIYKAFKEVWEDIGDDESEWDDVDKKDVVQIALEQYYEPEHGLGMEFGTYKELEIDELDSHHEFWFGGKCVAIQLEKYKKMLKDGKFE